MLKKIKKCLFLILFMFLNSMAFANGRCDQLEKEIMKNPNVLKAKVGQYDKRSQNIYGADIYLKNGGYLFVSEFDQNLSGNRLGVLYIGKTPDGTVKYYVACCYHKMKVLDVFGKNNRYIDEHIKACQLSILIKKKIATVDDIVNNYNEIYELAETLARETPEERTNRRNDREIQDNENFSNVLGNFENDEYWGQVFVQNFSADNMMGRGEPLFID